MKTFTYDNVSPAQIQNLTAELIKSGATVTNPAPDSWGAVGHGVNASVTYNGKESILTVVVASKPFFVSWDSIDERIKEELAVPIPVVDPPKAV